MIRFTLECDQSHSFESWFQSGSAFDALARAGHLSCPICTSTSVKKAIMAPRISTDAAAPPQQDTPQSSPATTPLATAPADSDVARAIEKLRKLVETTSEDVGSNFANEARAIHDGESPERSIYGQASSAEARALVEDGISIAPLPFIPRRKTN